MLKIGESTVIDMTLAMKEYTLYKMAGINTSLYRIIASSIVVGKVIIVTVIVKSEEMVVMVIKGK
jgi:hypothetical protein